MVQKQDVRSIKHMEHSRRLRNTLIAAGVGAGVGAVIGAATNLDPCGTASPCRSPIISTHESAGIVAVVGFVGGAVVGLLLPSHTTIYNAKTN